MKTNCKHDDKIVWTSQGTRTQTTEIESTETILPKELTVTDNTHERNSRFATKKRNWYWGKPFNFS